MEEGFSVMVLDYDDLQVTAPTHWGWSYEAVRLPNDRRSVDSLSGPCRTYCLGKPMRLQELEAMPADLQLRYLRKLRRMGATREAVGQMLGVNPGQMDTLGVCFDMPNPTAWAEFLK